MESIFFHAVGYGIGFLAGFAITIVPFVVGVCVGHKVGSTNN